MEKNFISLYNNLLQITNEKGTRLNSVVINHQDNKEKICRKFGVVSSKDLVRLEKSIQKRNQNRNR